MKLPIAPASLFGIVLGIAGLGGTWRLAHRVWGLPALVGEALMLVAFVVWVMLVSLYVSKWIWFREHAWTEAEHPVQCCFVGLIGVSTMLMALAALPYSVASSSILVVGGIILTFGFAIWRTGKLWHGGRSPESTTPVLYLPTVAGSFVAATTLGALGLPAWGQLAFGAGLFSWLAIESVLLHRLYMAAPLASALRPTLGIQLAPPTVGLVAYLSVTQGAPGLPAYALLGYAFLQFAVLLRSMPWIRESAAVSTYWGFTFGLSAIASAPLIMVSRGDAGPAATIAPVMFVVSNILIGGLAWATLVSLARGKPPASRFCSHVALKRPMRYRELFRAASSNRFDLL